MKVLNGAKWILYQNGWLSGEMMELSGITLVSFLDNGTLIYTDNNGDQWACNTGTTIPIIYNSDTTGLTINTIPYIGGISAYTYQLVVYNQHGALVTNECTYTSRNTLVATVAAGGLITGVYTGETMIVAAHPDMIPVQVSSNTFVVNQIVDSITPLYSSIRGATGLTFSALTYTDARGVIIPSWQVTRSGYDTLVITSISQTGGTMGFGRTGSTTITAAPTYASSVTPTTTAVLVTIDGNALTTGLTITTQDYMGGLSAYTYQLVVEDNNANVVTNECTYVSNNVNIATVSSTGLITAVYTGTTNILVKHPDMTYGVSSNTFIVNQVISTITPLYTALTGGTGLTFSALTYTDQSGYTIASSRLNRYWAEPVGVITSINSASGLVTYGYTGTTSIVAYGTFGSLTPSGTTIVRVTRNGVTG